MAISISGFRQACRPSLSRSRQHCRSTWIAFRLCLEAGVSRFERASYLLFLLIMLVYVLSNFMEATLFARGLLLNNIAMLVMFLLHRVALDEAIGRRLGAAA